MAQRLKVQSRLEKMKTIAEIAQSVVVCLAIIIGGFWTAFTFVSLRQMSNAELEQARLQKEIVGEESMNLSMKVTSGTLDQKRYSLIEVTLQNEGSKAIDLDLESMPPLRVARVQMNEDHTFSADESFSVGEPVHADGKAIVEQSRQDVEPKATKILNFYVELAKPGVYLYTFMSPIKGSDRAWMVKRFEVVP